MEHLTGTAAPAACLLVEIEAPSRLIPMLDDEAVAVQFDEWLRRKRHLRDALSLGLRDQLADPARVEACQRALRDQPGGARQAALGLIVAATATDQRQRTLAQANTRSPGTSILAGDCVRTPLDKRSTFGASSVAFS